MMGSSPPSKEETETKTAACNEDKCEDGEETDASTGEAEKSKCFSLSALQEEVDALRANIPAYVSGIGTLSKPKLICDDSGDLVEPDGDGPWDFTVCVRGGKEKPAYDHPFKVCIRFNDEYPHQPPTVRFAGVFHHALTGTEDDDNAMPKPFYYKILRNDDKLCTVPLVLQSIHEFLIDPLKSWGISEDSAPSRLTYALTANAEMNKNRLSTIQKYGEQCIHKELFDAPTLQAEWFEPTFWNAIQEGTPEAWNSILQEELPGEVFSFKMFTQPFCEKLVAEILNFYASGLEARRPNSMNNYGIILNEIGMEPFIDQLQKALQPIGDLKWPGVGNQWDGHHCFIVRYREGEDLGLDMHTDDSDVTFNICLGIEFEAAGLQFCGMMGAANHRKHTFTYKHVKGQCVCHLGRKRHGADDITSGERLNLILWNHSSTYRASKEYKDPDYVKEEGPPDAVCVSYTHDRDYGNFKAYPNGKEKHKGRGWCPPTPFAYEGFKADSAKETRGG